MTDNFSARALRWPGRARNLTPHEITIVVSYFSPDDGEDVTSVYTIPPDPAGPARIETSEREVGVLRHGDADFLPIRRREFGQTVNLPAPEPGVALIVSRVVAEAHPDRGDLFVPDGAVRDEAGRIIACTGLASLAIPEALDEFLLPAASRGLPVADDWADR